MKLNKFQALKNLILYSYYICVNKIFILVIQYNSVTVDLKLER